MTTQVIDDLQWRGLIDNSTDLDALREHVSSPGVRFYVGFDPTAPSLHMGNLLQVTTAVRLQRAGLHPYVLVGGATGMIGDPRQSGERTLNSLDVVRSWVERIRAQIEPYLSFEGANGATMVNNYDWTASLSVIDFLRDIGKHFPVNRMLGRDVVRNRLESGMSYTEFSYVLLQSMDYLNLHRDHGVSLQFGGSDQWGNVSAGVELVRRAEGAQVHGFTTPLVTKADGTKYGKTEGGAVWLDSQMMPPYAFHQFWLNVEDVKVGELLRYFTFLSRDEIEELEAQTREEPHRRLAQQRLADEVTAFVHGDEAVVRAKAAAAALFGRADIAEFDAATLESVLTTVPSVRVPSDDVGTFADLMAATGLVASKSEARRAVREGGAYVNNERLTDAEATPEAGTYLNGGWLLLRRGKKKLASVKVD